MEKHQECMTVLIFTTCVLVGSQTTRAVDTEHRASQLFKVENLYDGPPSPGL